MSILTTLLGIAADNWKWLVGAVMGLVALIGARQSGKKSERLKSQTKDLKNARDIEDRADAARARRDDRPLDERLRDLDGFRDK